MSATDPIADMLTAIRSALLCGHPGLKIPHSRLKSDIARVLKKEGYIEDFKVLKEGAKTALQIALKNARGGRVIVGLRRISTPGRRKYVNSKEIPRVLGGMGICILTTPRGVMSGQQAKKENVGGEVLCHVW
ncbi:MAG: 30S ribosomal protein S8 [Verrucomicrobiae bacterium]|nr:30S ribosomal protein S8 [Verrucomicrobiae bacterium]